MSQSDNVRIFKKCPLDRSLFSYSNAVSVPLTNYIPRQKQGVCEVAFGAASATAGETKGCFSNMQQLQELSQGRQKWPQQLRGSDLQGNVFVAESFSRPGHP